MTISQYLNSWKFFPWTLAIEVMAWGFETVVPITKSTQDAIASIQKNAGGSHGEDNTIQNEPVPKDRTAIRAGAHRHRGDGE